MIRLLLDKFVLNYIQKNACARNGYFMKDVMIRCHRARQEEFDDQTIPGRIYDVFEDCAKAIPQVVSENAIDNVKWRKTVAQGIYLTVREVLQLPTMEQEQEEEFKLHIENKNW